MQETPAPTPITNPTPKPRSLTWLWTSLIILGAVIVLAVAAFLALRIVADNAANDYKRSLASYETSLSKSFNGSTDGTTLETAIDGVQPPIIASVPMPAASSDYQQAKKQSETVASTVTALKQSVSDYATLSGFMKNYLDLESQEQALVSKITLNSAGITNIESIQAIAVKKHSLVSSTNVPNVSVSVMDDLNQALNDKTDALTQLLVAARAKNYSGFNTATTSLNTASSKEEAALGTLDAQTSSLQDSLNQNVAVFNKLVAKVVQ